MSWIQSLSSKLSELSGLVNAVSAFSTFAAVAVSLKLARAGYKPKMVALAYVGQILHADGAGEYSRLRGRDNIAVSIQNRGPVPITLNLSSFNWKFWRHDVALMVNPISPDMRHQNLVIPPAEGRLVILSDRTVELRKGMLEQGLWLLRWRIRLEIHGTDGVIHYAKLSRGLRKLLTEAPKET